MSRRSVRAVPVTVHPGRYRRAPYGEDAQYGVIADHGFLRTPRSVRVIRHDPGVPQVRVSAHPQTRCEHQALAADPLATFRRASRVPDLPHALPGAGVVLVSTGGDERPGREGSADGRQPSVGSSSPSAALRPAVRPAVSRWCPVSSRCSRAWFRYVWTTMAGDGNSRVTGARAPPRPPDGRADSNRDTAARERLDTPHGRSYPSRSRGAIAQLGERLHGMQQVRGSIPRSSTTEFLTVDSRPSRGRPERPLSCPLDRPVAIACPARPVSGDARSSTPDAAGGVTDVASRRPRCGRDALARHRALQRTASPDASARADPGGSSRQDHARSPRLRPRPSAERFRRRLAGDAGAALPPLLAARGARPRCRWCCCSASCRCRRRCAG